jgi:glycosyltransferase involved in cell wall biosynthesis
VRVAGDGPEYRSLKRVAGASVEFCGRVSAEDLRELYARSRALLVPGEEDFGITMVESLASGKPVLALGRGGAREIVLQEEPLAGILYAEAVAEELEDALARFEVFESEFRPKQLQGWAAQFSEEHFRLNFQRILASPNSVPESVPAPFA